MSRRIIVTIALSACTATHDPNAVMISGRDCYTCHKPDYVKTDTWAPDATYPSPVAHSIQGCDTNCATCHVAPTANTPAGTGWTNNLGGCMHPETSFPLVSNSDATRGPVGASPHANIDCVTCHDPASPASSAMGANTNCVQCHPNNSTQQTSHVPLGASYSYQASVQNFCLSCHPAGLALGHPETIIQSNHQGSTCAKCHDASISSDFTTNPNCMASGCHVLSKVETQSEHMSTRYMSAKATPVAPWTVNDFCLTCHEGGKSGG